MSIKLEMIKIFINAISLKLVDFYIDRRIQNVDIQTLETTT